MLKKLLTAAFSACFICTVVSSASGAVFLYEGGQEKLFFPSSAEEVYNAGLYIEEEKGENNDNIDYDGIDFTQDVLEDYVVGVTAAEMPANFSYEALRAQAVASRTYAVKNLGENVKALKSIDSSKIGQAYISVEDMKTRWQDGFQANYDKIRAAVYSTRGLIMKYNGEPIEAVFHSTSSGKTETAENVWGRELPYIKSVESRADVNAPGYAASVSFEKEEFERKIKNGINEADTINNIFDSFQIEQRSEAGYVLTVKIGDKTVSGGDIRSALGLRSTDFEIKKEADTITFETKGYGHGAGMSQYGAEFMAREGKTFEEILNYYYFDIKIENL